MLLALRREKICWLACAISIKRDRLQRRNLRGFLNAAQESRTEKIPSAAHGFGSMAADCDKPGSRGRGGLCVDHAVPSVLARELAVALSPGAGCFADTGQRGSGLRSGGLRRD